MVKDIYHLHLPFTKSSMVKNIYSVPAQWDCTGWEGTPWSSSHSNNFFLQRSCPSSQYLSLGFNKQSPHRLHCMLVCRKLTKLSAHPLVPCPAVRRRYGGLWFWGGTLAASPVPEQWWVTGISSPPAEGRVSNTAFPQPKPLQDTPAAVRPGVRTSQFHLKIQTLPLDITPKPATSPKENPKYNLSHSKYFSFRHFSTTRKTNKKEMKNIKVFLGNQFLVKFFALVQNRTSCRGSPCLNSSTSSSLWLRTRTALLGSQGSWNLSEQHRNLPGVGWAPQRRAAPCTAPCYRGKAAFTLTRFAWQAFQRLLPRIRAAGTACISYFTETGRLNSAKFLNPVYLLSPSEEAQCSCGLSELSSALLPEFCPFEGQTQAGWEQGNPQPLSTPEFGISVCSKAGKCKGTVPI